MSLLNQLNPSNGEGKRKCLLLTASAFLLSAIVVTQNRSAEEKFPLQTPIGQYERIRSSQQVNPWKNHSDLELIGVSPLWNIGLPSLAHGKIENPRNQESLLCELIRRGGKDVEHHVETIFQTHQSHLNILMTRYRLKGLRDPLVIEVDLPRERLRAGTRNMPFIDVAVKNVSDGERTIVQDGGDYRSGRLSRWRIHAWDADGNPVQSLGRLSSIGGGFTGHTILKVGDLVRAKLHTGAFVDIRKPGRYTVQIYYHDRLTIADLADSSELDNLIVVKSELFELDVCKGPFEEIYLAPESSQRAKQLFAKLDETAPRIMVSSYEKWAHEFIEPSSPHGQILLMGRQAVPALIDAVQDNGLSFRKRAWLLILLFSIMPNKYVAVDDPQKAYGGYEHRSPYGYCRYGSPTDSKNTQDQQPLVKAWKKFQYEYIIVHEQMQ